MDSSKWVDVQWSKVGRFYHSQYFGSIFGSNVAVSVVTISQAAQRGKEENNELHF